MLNLQKYYDDDPFLKTAAGVHKRVTAHQLPGGVRGEGLVVPHGGVGENVVFRLDGVRQAGDKLPFLGEAVEKLLFALGQPLQLEGVDTGGVAHFPQQAAFLVHHVVQQVLVGLRRHTENVIPAVAVAADRVYVSGFAQLHDVSERTEAVRPFFEEVAVDDENIVRVEADFFQ